MKLNRRQRQELFDALREAFTPESLDRFLLYQLGKRRYEIVGDADFLEIIDKVIEDAEDNNWVRDLVQAALEVRSKDEGFLNFVKHFPEYEPAPPVYAHVLFISTPGEPPDVGPATIPQLFDLVKAEAVRQQASDPTLHISESKDERVVILSSDDALALFKFAVNIAKTVNSPGAVRLRMGMHSAVCATGAANRRHKIPPEGIEIARRVTQLASDGHILATSDAAELIKAETGFDAAFNAGFDAVFHGPVRCELRPFLFKDIYNVYLRLSDANAQQTFFGNEHPHGTNAPEGVIKEIRVPTTLKVLKEEKIRVVFCPEVSYVKVQFKFENAADSNIRISCEKPEEEDYTFEYDFEGTPEEREHFFSIQAINAAKDHNFLLEMRCYDKQGEQIILPREWPIKLRRNFLLWLWNVIWRRLSDSIRSLKWYVRILLVAATLLAVSLVAFLLLPASWQEYLKLKLYWPRPAKIEEFREEFRKLVEDDPRKRWDLTEYNPVDGTGAPGIDGALYIKGPQTIVLKPDFLNKESIYDSEVHIQFKYGSGSTRMGWIFRAQADKESGYVFMLDRQSDNTLKLSAMISEHGVLYPMDDKQQSLEVPLGVYNDGDWIFVVAKMNGYKFDYKMQYSDRDNDFHPVGIFEVKNGARFRHGNVGIWVPKDNEMIVDFFRLYKVGYQTIPESVDQSGE